MSSSNASLMHSEYLRNRFELKALCIDSGTTRKYNLRATPAKHAPCSWPFFMYLILRIMPPLPVHCDTNAFSTLEKSRPL